MEVGQVGFHDPKAVLRTQATKNNDIVNRLTKTKQERFPNLAAEREAYEASIRNEKRAAERARRKEEEQALRDRQREAEERSYSRIMDSSKMQTNVEQASKYSSVQEAEEDFM